MGTGKIVAATAFTAFGLLVLPILVHAQSDKKMEPIYDLKNTTELQAQTFKSGGLLGSYKHISLFPVPQANSVGTNDMGNAITLISFPKGSISFDKHFRHADDISGGGKFLPTISNDLIGFGQVRVFHLFDFKKKLHREYRIVFPFTQYIDNIAIADSSQRHFLFEIEAQKDNPKNSFDVDIFLQLIDLSGSTPTLLKEIREEPGTVLTTSNDRVFLYRVRKQKLWVYDMNLESAHHPLEDVMKKHMNILNPEKDEIGFSRIRLHPTLPFAILYGGYHGSTYINWSNDREALPHLLIDYTTDFTFSPDGKWVVFQKDYPEPAKTYLMPVSDKYPHYLGSPIHLSNVSFNIGKFAWSTNPTAIVGSLLDKLYRWDLENQDFPEKGKMSFHEYVVQEDLKKLTREKKQGLGK